MASFDQAIEIILAHEGGYVDRPQDRGGPTSYGISTRFLQQNCLQDNIRSMTLERAKELYAQYFWTPLHLDQFPDTHQLPATKCLDIAVNCGIYRGAIILQEALVHSLGYDLIVDGRIGPKTLAAIAQCPPQLLVDALCAHQTDFYRSICLRDPSQEIFFRGWAKRAAWGKSHA